MDTMACFSDVGSVSQAAITVSKSSGLGLAFWYTLGTHFMCFIMLGSTGEGALICCRYILERVSNALSCCVFARFCSDSALVEDADSKGSSPTAGASLTEAQPLFLEGVAFSVSAPTACRYTLGTHFSVERRLGELA